MFLQSSLFGMCDPDVDAGFTEARRVALDDRSWVEYTPGWLTGADVVFDELLDTLELRQRTNIPMYDSLVAEPRLTAAWHADDYPAGGPTPLLDRVRRLLIERYGRPFDSIGFNLYRDGSDSVAWHGDRHRENVTDPVVAILSVGQARPLRLRQRKAVDRSVPRRGTARAGAGAGAGDGARAGAAGVDERRSASSSWNLGRGDLFVMGGACQHDWEHCVPKMRRSPGPRLSITFRHDTARDVLWGGAGRVGSARPTAQPTAQPTASNVGN